MPNNSINLAIGSDPVPDGFCAISNEKWQELIRLLHVTIGTDPSINFGNVNPTPDKYGLPWLRTNSNGSPDGYYVFSGGLWLKRHPAAPGSIILYRGAIADIPTFDGGNANTVSEIDGAFWQRVTQLDARMPIQVGTLASSKVLAIGDTGGEENHKLSATEAKTPSHYHLEGLPSRIGASDSVSCYFGAEGIPSTAPNQNPNWFETIQGGGGSNAARKTSAVGATGENDAHNNLPPYYVICFIERTSRLYYKIVP